jgi:hypothetical protein
MVTRYLSRLEKLGTPPWVRGICVVALGFILLDNLALITFIGAPGGIVHRYAILVFLGILALVALLFLLRLWRAMVSPQRQEKL